MRTFTIFNLPNDELVARLRQAVFGADKDFFRDFHTKKDCSESARNGAGQIHGGERDVMLYFSGFFVAAAFIAAVLGFAVLSGPFTGKTNLSLIEIARLI